MDRYRLAPLRDARTRDERSKQGDLAGAVGDARATADDVASAAARVAACRATIDEASRTRDAQIAAGASIATLTIIDRYLLRRRHELLLLYGERLRAETAHNDRLTVIDAARDRLIISRAERELIERHFARWRADRRKLAQRRED